MKKILIAMLIVIAGMIVWLYWPGTIREPEFITIRDMQLKQTGQFEAEAKATAVFFNPNKIEATLLNTELKVYSKGSMIGLVSQTDVSAIPPMSEFDFPLLFRVNALEVAYSQGLSSMVEKVLNEDRQIPIEIEGYCRVKAKDQVFRIPVHHRDVIRFK